MSERIHDDEPDTSEPVVRALLRAELPQWSDSKIEYLATSGTDNAMWRVRVDGGRDVVARLPRRPGAAAGVLRETAVLRELYDRGFGTVVRTPRVRHVGEPHEQFPHHWSVLDWIDGTDAWIARSDLDRRPLHTLAVDLAKAVAAIGCIDIQGGRERRPGDRGGPLGPLLERLDGWLTSSVWNASNLIDVPAVRRLAAEAHEVVDEPAVRGFVHGDLAQDLAPAWAVLTAVERPAFREALAPSDAAWIRGRTFELEHAVGGVLYYLPKKHPLGDVMSRTLERILASS